MKEMSEELDRLIQDEATKNRQIVNKEVLVKTRPCGHKAVIQAKEQELEKQEEEIEHLRDQIEHFLNGKKDKELNSVI